MDLKNHVEASLYYASSGLSKLPREVLDLPGLTGDCIQHYLNQLCGFAGVQYLEIGVFRGATFTAAMYGNQGHFTGIDNYCLENCPRNKTPAEIEEELIHTFARYGPKGGVGTITMLFHDCFTLDLARFQQLDPVNVYFYDGDHSAGSQERALTYYEPVLADTVVYCVDDWNEEEVREGTRAGLEQIGHEVIFQREFFTDRNGDRKTWWNGFAVFCLRRPILKGGKR